MSYGKVGVLLGGYSSEREVSLKSGEAVANALKAKGVNVVEIGREGDIEEEILKENIDAAFIALHGKYGEDGQVQAFLEKNNIPYTGSSSKVSRITIDKAATKEMLGDDEEILMAPSVLFDKSDSKEVLEGKYKSLGFPFVLKPVTEGSSVGLSLIEDEKAFAENIKEAFALCDTVMAEKYVEGKELTVGIVGDKIMPIVNIVPKNKFYDFEAKYTKGMSNYIIPAKIDEKTTKTIQKIAYKCYKKVGCRHLSRVDFIYDEKEKKAYFLEINTIPGFTATSLLPKAAKQEGIDFEDLCLSILDMAVKDN